MLLSLRNFFGSSLDKQNFLNEKRKTSKECNDAVILQNLWPLTSVCSKAWEHVEKMSDYIVI